MRRALAAAAAWLLLAGSLPEPGWAQSAPQRPRQAREPAARAAREARPRAGTPEASARRPADDRRGPVTVDADRLENLQKEGLVVFTGNVVATQNASRHYADRMEVYLDESGDRIVRTVSTGNVRVITKDCQMGTANRAEYYDAEQRVVLIGNARVWREDNVVTGERITIYLAEDRSVVEGGRQERVKAVFYPRGQEAPGPSPKPGPGGACDN